MKYKYDIAISFAEEDRNIAVALHCGFKLKNLNTYYYPEKSAETLAHLLDVRLKALYESEAEYAVIVLSKKYLDKPYCKIELEAIKSRMAAQTVENTSYVVVLKTDETLPSDIGLPTTLTYKDWDYDPENLAGIFWQMLGKPEEKNERIINHSTSNTDNSKTFKNVTIGRDFTFNENS